MKLRQKLAVVLAASAVVTSVPVVTFADTTNAVRNVNQVLKNTEMGYNTKTTDAVITVAGTQKTVTDATYVVINNNGKANYNDRYVPAFEFTPKAEYETGSQKQSFFISLSKDTNFDDKAFLTAVNAQPAGGYTNYQAFEAINTDFTDATAQSLVFDGDKVVNATNTAWNDKKVSDVINDIQPKLVINYDGGKTLTITRIPDLSTKENDVEFKSSIRVDLEGGKWTTADVVKVPLLAKAGGDKVIIKVDGHDSFVSSFTQQITGDLTDKKLKVTAPDVEKLTTDGGEVGKFVFTESQIRALKDAKNKKIKFSLPSNSDLEFVVTDLEVKGGRGLAGKKATIKASTIRRDDQYRRGSQDDLKTLIVDFDQLSASFWDNTAYGELVLTGIKVVPEGKLADAGEVNVTVEEYVASGDKKTDLIEKTTLKVAEIKDYEVTLKCEKPVDIKAGRSGIVNDKRAKFVLEESVKDSLVDSRKIEFKLENGYFFGPADVANSANSSYTSKSYEDAAEAYFKQLVTDEVIKFEDKAKDYEVSSLKLDIDAEGKVYGFTARFPKLESGKADKLTITAPIATDVQSTGDVKLKVSNLYTRYTDQKDVECVVANIKAPIEVSLDKAAIKVGLQGQEAGKITIKETDKGMLERGWLFLSASDVQGVTFAKLPTIKSTPDTANGLKIENISLSKDKTVVAFEITKTSKEAATIEVSDLVFTTDRTVPEANYGLEIWGTALTDENELDITNLSNTTNVLRNQNYKYQYTDSYIVKDFIQMTTPNTEDIKNGALKAVTSTFTLNTSNYKVDGKEYQMDAPAYAKDGRIMVPLRYVAYAFGLQEDNVLFANGTATVVAGEKIIQVKLNNKNIYVNGTAIPMDTVAEAKDGRIYVPMSYIASALGVTPSWDDATKTATFSNVAK